MGLEFNYKDSTSFNLLLCILCLRHRVLCGKRQTLNSKLKTLNSKGMGLSAAPPQWLLRVHDRGKQQSHRLKSSISP